MGSAALSHPIRTYLAGHHGIAGRAMLAANGISRWQLDRWVAEGLLAPVHQGVYRITTSPPTFEGRCLAACLADPDLVIGGPSAARLWDFKHTPRDPGIVAIVPHDRTPVGSGVTLRRSNQMPAADVVERPDGIRLTTPPRTWFDRARDMGDDGFEALTEHVLDRYCQVPTLWATARRLMARGRPGSARVRRVMSQRVDWQKPADSTLELDVLRALERRGVHLVRQFALRLPNGVTIHLDGADPDLRWGVEVDHITWHGGRQAVARDKGRDRGARRIGWDVHRVDDQEWRDDRNVVLDDLVDLYLTRGGRLRTPRPG